MDGQARYTGGRGAGRGGQTHSCQCQGVDGSSCLLSREMRGPERKHRELT
jgi:hypothetical protein